MNALTYTTVNARPDFTVLKNVPTLTGTERKSHTMVKSLIKTFDSLGEWLYRFFAHDKTGLAIIIATLLYFGGHWVCKASNMSCGQDTAVLRVGQ